MDDPKVVILIFASGKLVYTGATKEVEVPRTIARVERIAVHDLEKEKKSHCPHLKENGSDPVAESAGRQLEEAR
jgi:hypothetical protein